MGLASPPLGLGADALRAGALGKYRPDITRSVLERHGLSTGDGLAVLGGSTKADSLRPIER